MLFKKRECVCVWNGRRRAGRGQHRPPTRPRDATEIRTGPGLPLCGAAPHTSHELEHAVHRAHRERCVLQLVASVRRDARQTASEFPPKGNFVIFRCCPPCE
eukprot:5959319-Prymnesium_polylepis.2